MSGKQLGAQAEAEPKLVTPVSPINETPDVQSLLNEAIRLHQAGQLSEAEELYRRILALDPRHAAALHLLGMIAYQQGRCDNAADLIGSAIAINGSVAAYHSNLGNALYELGRFNEALASYDAALRIKPDYALAHSNRGNALKDIGRLDDALASYDAALRIKPDFAEVHSNRGIALKELGRLDDALASYDTALRIRPDFAEVYSNRGIALKELGRFDDALASYDAALRIKPDYAEAHSNRGNALYDLGRLGDALASYDAALRIKPNMAGAHTNRGNVLRDLGRLEEALASHDAALRIKAGYAEAHSNRGNALLDLGRLDEALGSYDAALRIKPDFAEAHSNRGNALYDLGRLEDALVSCDAALRIKPDYAEAHSNCGNVLRDLGRLEEALVSYGAALRIKPGLAEAHTNRGNALYELYRFDDALASYEAALRIKPDYTKAHSNLIFCLHYRSDANGGTILAAAQRFAALFEPISPFFANSPDPGRPLRVGLVSGDFGRHPVGYFLAPFLANRSRTDVEIFCYSTYARGDDLTGALRASADHWRSLVGMTDEAAAARIRADAIDILVDLSGHTRGNRLPLFARRPAPVQATWLGFWGTTGLAAMDYILSDAVTIAPGEEGFYSERVLRLAGGRFCYAPPAYAPEPVPPPCLRDGVVTFGSFNNLAKVGPDVMALWARVLHAVPGARLLLKWRSLADEGTRRSLIETFAGHGIAADRLVLRGASPHVEMLAEYGDMDIALDPFPFSGALTSCEALWMGVPVVTLPGTAAPSRQTLAFLKALGLERWAATAPDDYVRIAAGLAADRGSLSELRRNMRPRMAASALCDGLTFARDVETAFRTMWQNWCTVNASKVGVNSIWAYETQAKAAPASPFNETPDVQSLFNEAVRFHQAGRLSEAEEFYRRILDLDPRHADALHLLGVIAYQQGRCDIAADLIGSAIEINGSVAAYHSDHGNALFDLGRFDDALASCNAVLRIRPDLAEAHSNRGIVLRELGRLDDALASYDAALRIRPNFAEAHYNRGNALYDLGRLEEALASYDAALRIKPDYAEAHSNRGNALYDLGHLEDALASYDATLHIKPDLAEVHSNRGNVLKELGRREEALASYDAALGIKPDYAEAHSNRGNVLHDLGRLDEALGCYDAALRIKPDFAAAHYNRGNALYDLGRLEDALASCDAALRIRPDYAEAHSNRGKVLFGLGRLDEALGCYDAALRIEPVLAEAHTNRGNALCDLGRLGDALASYEAVLRIRPDFAVAHSNLIFCLHYRSDANGGAILAVAQRFAALFEPVSPSFANSPDPGRRLRVGLVSGDFGRHPVGYFLAPFLANHAQADVEIYCYSTFARGDDLTAHLRASADHWRSLVGVSDEAAAAQIRADAIDILVDLSGHTRGNRLPLFARRPAPVQATWLGYWGTTGLAAMDYILSDVVTIPPNEEDFYSERVLRLAGGRFCYAAPAYAPAPAPPPCLQGGAVTFGSFNNLAKVGPEVLALWAAVLRAVPGSRLLLKWRSLTDDGVRRSLIGVFAGHGIAADRLVLRGASSHVEMLAEYGDMDIALDPFPFSGALTSCEALWMGVPVVTLPGTAAPSRQTLAFLKVLGLESWAATGPDDYVRIAAGLAADRGSLSELRRNMRPRMAASALCDGPAFARDVETAFRTMWRNWCTINASKAAPASPFNEAPDVQSLLNEAGRLHQAGQLSEAEEFYRRILDLDPRHADALHLLGVIAYQQGRCDIAADLIGSAIAINGGADVYHSNHGNALYGLGRREEALASYDAALRINPDNAVVHSNRGNALYDLGRLDDALASCDAALRIKPDYAEAHSNRGNALYGLGRLDDALASYDAALRIKPDYAEAHSNRGTALTDLGRLEDALASCDAALRIKPDYAEAHSNRGNTLKDLGRFEHAVASYEAALRIKPDYAEAHSNLILCRHYRSDASGRAILAAAQRFAALFEPVSPSFANSPDPGRRLRVGLVSGDFRQHPVGNFLAPFLANHAQADVEIYCYSTYACGDDLTAHLRASADRWRSLVGMSDEAAAAQIRADGIDILVDLSGHTSHNRLPLFARRPAPVQATWLGFWGTTGLAAIDYILSDAVTIPPGEEGFYSERVLRLAGGRFCYTPPHHAPAPPPPPCYRDGAVTFGSFNNLAKVGPDVMALWAAVLRAVPGSRLLLKWRSLTDEGVRRRLIETFAGHGIAADRLVLRGASSHVEMLAEYGDMDIALDPFPFSGALTSCEALWMGVPVVTLPGTAAPSRQTLAFLKVLGLESWAATGPDDYVRIAAGLAADPASLSELRRNMRPRMAASALCDGPAFARDVETAFRTMWQNWCAKRGARVQPPSHEHESNCAVQNFSLRNVYLPKGQI